MQNLDRILSETICLARSLKIPVSDRIIPMVFVNTRRKTILGTCERQANGEYKIVISAFVLRESDDAVKNVIAHEVLHTCKGCSNHGSIWQKYAKIMGEAMGQEIKRTGKSPQTDKLKEEARFVLVCESCGKEIYRLKQSRLVQHPERYRCVCGGKIRRKK